MYLLKQPKKQRGKIYNYYSIAESFREQGEPRIRILFRLGAISEEQAEKIRLVLKIHSDPDLVVGKFQDIVFSDHWKYLDIAVLHEIWNNWGLSNIFKVAGLKDVPTSAMVEILTINRCLDPGSKYYVSQWFPTTSGSFIWGIPAQKINDDRIYRELSIIEEHKETLERRLYDTLKAKEPEAFRLVFYDLSNSYFEGNCCPYGKPGFSKSEGYKKKRIVLSLLVNRYGYPFCWDVMEGDTADVETIEGLVKTCKKRFEINDITLVFDRGMVSGDNLAFLDENEYRYITALDKNQIPKVKDIRLERFVDFTLEKVREQISGLSEFRKFDEDFYYECLGVDKGIRYILGFNPQLFQDERKDRNERLAKTKSFLDSKNEALSRAKRDRTTSRVEEQISEVLKKKRIKSFIKYKLLPVEVDNGARKTKSFHIEYEILESRVARAQKLDGCFVFITNQLKKDGENLRLAADQIIQAYRDKNRIEEAFRNLKSFIKFQPIYVFKPEHVRAHYTVCVLSYLLNITVTNMLREEKDFDVKSAFSAYKILETCHIGQIDINNPAKKSGKKLNPPTPLQKQLLKILDCEKVIKPNYLQKIMNS